LTAAGPHLAIGLSNLALHALGRRFLRHRQRVVAQASLATAARALAARQACTGVSWSSFESDSCICSCASGA